MQRGEFDFVPREIFLLNLANSLPHPEQQPRLGCSAARQQQDHSASLPMLGKEADRLWLLNGLVDRRSYSRWAAGRDLSIRARNLSHTRKNLLRAIGKKPGTRGDHG